MSSNILIFLKVIKCGILSDENNIKVLISNPTREFFKNIVIKLTEN